MVSLNTRLVRLLTTIQRINSNCFINSRQDTVSNKLAG